MSSLFGVELTSTMDLESRFRNRTTRWECRAVAALKFALTFTTHLSVLLR